MTMNAVWRSRPRIRSPPWPSIWFMREPPKRNCKISSASPILIDAIDVTHDHERRLALAAAHPVSTMALHLVHEGTTEKELQDLLGEPYLKNEFNGNGRGRRGSNFADYRYTDGESDFGFLVVDGEVRRVTENDRCNLTKDSAIFATVFQFFYLRLAVFFGCVGI